MKQRMAIPIIFSWSAAFSSSWATLLTTSRRFISRRAGAPNLLDIVSQLPQNIPELHHVLRDGVEILQSAVDVAGALVQVQGVVQNNFVAGEGWTCYLQVKHDHFSLPLSVELVGLTLVDIEELFLQVGRQVDGGIKILPVGRVQF